MIKQGIANEQLKVRIRELENEIFKIIQEHKNALIDTAN
jgi:hypothetical protein